MKILIVTNDLPPRTNANSSIICRLAEVLQKKHGAEIAMLGLQTAEGQTYEYPTVEITNQFAYTETIPSGLSPSKKLLRLLAHPTLWPMFLRYQLSRHPLERLYLRQLRRLLQQGTDIDCVLAVSEPTDIPCAMTKLNSSIPWISYRLDPWSTNFQHCDDPDARAEEQAADRSCSAVFVQPAVYQEYVSGVNSAPDGKLHAAEFPNLRPLPESGEPPKWNHSQINCAYVGQFYPDIRNPSYMLRLFSALRGSGIVLHVIGDAPGQAEQWRNLMADNIVCHGRVPYREAVAYMKAADILVNIGNSVTNQMPSKLIDYLSAGKPILNLYQSDACPTLRYMERYPLGHSAAEEDGLSEETISRILAFIKEYNGKSLSFDEVEKLFPECTPEYVADQVYEVLQEITYHTSEDKRTVQPLGGDFYEF